MKRKLTLSAQIYISNILLVLLTVLAAFFCTLYLSISAKQKDMDSRIRSVSLLVSNLEEVKQVLTTKSTSLLLTKELDLFVDSMDDIDIIVVCDTNSVRYYHPDQSRIGQTFTGADEGDILAGEPPYIVEGFGTLGNQRRSFHAVRDEDGTIIGFVMASVLTESLARLRSSIISLFLMLLAGLILLGMILSYFSMKALKRIFMGYEPEEFREMYIERTEVLDALEEGIFAINNNAELILMNQSAKLMLGLPPTAQVEGTQLHDIYPESKLPETLKTKTAEYNINFTMKTKDIISNRIPIWADGKMIGAVAIFRDRTELTKLAEELTGTKYMVDTLRAFNHEFMNKLHIILGLLEIQKITEAKEYILKTGFVSGKAVSDIVQRVPSPNLAALLIGKLILAGELGIRLILKSDSLFPADGGWLPVDCLVTIIGNLLENAIYELNKKNFPVKEIELGIYAETNYTMIICDDTGGGIAPEIMDRIYERGITTKGSGHGSGMALIREITDRYHGDIVIDTEENEGTSIRITIPAP